MALLDTLRYDGGQSATSLANAEDANSEGKYGIPRFGGEPHGLQEYLYRVRARAARESHMDPSEVKKLGPLGLRLLEGLRGNAFKLAQQIEVSKLGEKDGHEALLLLFEKSLKPRKDLEARELYAAGARDGGLLARQTGEAMSSYVLRRRTWWSHLQQLDDSIQVSEGILAEQMLQNSGLTDDQKLMIRTTLHGKLTVDKVGNELLNQHPRIQDRERHLPRRGFNSFRDHKKDWKGRNSHKGYGRSYQAMDEVDDNESTIPWDSQSQSLAGFTEDITWDDDDDLSYHSVDDGENFMAEYVSWYLDEGLDLESDEACALAAEALQLEYEAYSLRHSAKGKGHGGFSGQRHFEVSGSLSLQEKRARLQQLKLRTECRKCGQRGHWMGDRECPKSSGKGKSRTSSTTPSTASTSTSMSKGKKGSGKSSPKTRVVYFAMHDEENKPDQEDVSFMAWNFGRSSSGPPMSPTPAMTQPGSMTVESTATQSLVDSLYARGWTADQVLDLLLRAPTEAATAQVMDAGGWMQHPAPTSSTPTPAPSLGMPTGVIDQVLSTLHDMDVEEEEHSVPPLPSAPAPSSVDSNLTAAPATPLQEQCSHPRTTTRGTNGYYFIETCLDCNQVLKREKKTKASPFNPTPEGHTKDRALCQHYRVTWRGSNGINWRNSCLDCGKVTRGRWDDKHFPATGTTAPSRQFLLGAIGQPVQSDKHFDTRAVQEIIRSTLIVANVKSKENNDQLSLEDLHKIIDAVAVNVQLFGSDSSSTTTTAAPGPSVEPRTPPRTPPRSSTQQPESEELYFWGRRTINFGKYKGHPFWYGWQDSGYVDWCLNEVNTGSCKGMKDLADYFTEKRRKDQEEQHTTPGARAEPPRTPTRTPHYRDSPNRGYMAMGEEESVQEDQAVPEQWLVAVLDSGCNKTCHGDRWMKRYMEATDMDSSRCPLRQEACSIKGINGNVSTHGVRRLEVCFELENASGSFAVGAIDSTELVNSDAPLLLSIRDQRRLQLQMDLSDEHDKVYSKLFGGYIKVTEFNGLLGLHLLPSQAALLSSEKAFDTLEIEPELYDETELYEAKNDPDGALLTPSTALAPTSPQSSTASPKSPYLAVDEETTKV